MDQQRAYELADKWQQGTITDEEMTEFSKYYDARNKDVDIILPAGFAGNEAVLSDRIWSKVIKETTAQSPFIERIPQHNRFRTRMAVAASIAVLFSIGAYLWFIQERKNTEVLVSTLPSGIPPGREGAMLTLADGSVIELDSAGNGILANESGTKVLLKDKQLIYDAGGKKAEAESFNTMSTPIGRQFRLTLPDGTRAWLNTASSIRYPTNFNGADRKVTITGEAYFEVTQNKLKPFRVLVNDMEVEVLGTSFNINSYANEGDLKTTLLDGAVRIKHSTGKVLLKPGQQAILQRPTANTARIDIKNDADIRQVMAWKEGVFDFNGADLFTVMRELERWYGIEVSYEGKIRPLLFFGKMSRNVNLGIVLDWLKGSGVNYRFEKENKLIIVP